MTKRCKNCGWPNDDNATRCQKCNAPLDSAAQATPLRSTAYESARDGSAPTSPESSGESLRRTVSENQFFGTDLSGGNRGGGSAFAQDQRETINSGTTTECQNCHYQVRAGVSMCPNCGTPISVGGGRQQPPQQQPTTKACPKCGAQNPEDAKFCNSCGASMSPNPQYTNRSGENGAKQHAGTINPWMQPSSGTFCTLKPIAWEGENVQHSTLSFSGNTIILNRANTDPNNQSITSQEQAELTCEDGEWYIIDKSAMHTTYIMASRKMKLKKGDTIILGNRLFEFN